ncbi:hypothetical protein [Mammaliicoccus sciuri]|uniref:hypothetical protein n=1 Tax=Mammaliicoccus sciuri TaxID=1296 RepID=UPI000E6A901C|nr:hypothetical protein [Mammaliicoccus sciuri]RIN92408.1 hypothetical protein BU003_02145 [Mammaliicoccus sciuri]
MNNKEAQIGNDRKSLFLDSLTELTKVEFNNLCEKSSKPRNKLLYKAYKRTNSLKKYGDYQNYMNYLYLMKNMRQL